MKNNLENNIKDSLNGFEMPYDASAWTSLSNKLDQVIPTTPTKPSNLKWYLGGAAVIAVIVTGALLLNQSEEKGSTKVSDNTTVVNTPTAQSAETTASQNKANEGQSSSTQNMASNSAEEVPSNDPSTTSTPTSEPNDQNIHNQVNALPNKNSQGNLGNGGDNKDRIVPTNPVGSKVLIPAVSNICLGEAVTVNNTNDVDLVISGPNFKTVVPANKKKSFTPESDGNYRVSYMKDGVSKSEPLFAVNDAPSADIVMNDVEDNGLPTVEFSTPSNGTKYSWNLDNETGTYSGNEVTAHFFNKKDYTVTLKVTNANGCTNTATKKVSIDVDYNLYAADAIQTSDPDQYRNSFMPSALTVRNVDFNMIIIEPSTGSIIFETSDATNRWTGVDRRTGQFVDVNKAYIWKVTLKNPVKGEKSEYKGTVIRVQ